jgi:hypothetical protein
MRGYLEAGAMASMAGPTKPFTITYGVSVRQSPARRYVCLRCCAGTVELDNNEIFSTGLQDSLSLELTTYPLCLPVDCFGSS